jgi:hypothetical protein
MLESIEREELYMEMIDLENYIEELKGLTSEELKNKKKELKEEHSNLIKQIYSVERDAKLKMYLKYIEAIDTCLLKQGKLIKKEDEKIVLICPECNTEIPIDQVKSDGIYYFLTAGRHDFLTCSKCETNVEIDTKELKNIKRHHMNEEELKIWKSFGREVEKRFKLMQLPDNYKGYEEKDFQNGPSMSTYMGYSSIDGYYIIQEDWHSEELILKTKSIEEALAYFLEPRVESRGFDLELENRKKHELEWHYVVTYVGEKKIVKTNLSDWKYNLEYDGRKYAFEYAIMLLQRTGIDEILNRFIDKCTTSMNHHFKSPHWFFDKSKMCFVEIPSQDNTLQEYTFEIKDLPTFKFSFPQDLGECVKNNNVFELKKNNIQNIRVMISMCESEDKLEESARAWIEKNKEALNMGEKEHRKENINNIPIEVYILGFTNKPNLEDRIYKMGYVNCCKITISGVISKEEIINKAFETLVCVNKTGSIMTRDELAIKISKCLNELYEKLEASKKSKLHFRVSIKDESVAKNCTPWVRPPYTSDEKDGMEILIRIINERTTIKKFEILISWISGDDPEEEYNDINRITIHISNDQTIKIKYECENEDKDFTQTIENIIKLINDNSDKTVEIVRVKTKKKVRLPNPTIDFGILGKYQLSEDDYDSEDNLTIEQIYNRLNIISQSYAKNLEKINRKIFFRMYKALYDTRFPLWESENFNKIIDPEKLPSNFYQMSEKEKSDAVYIDGFNEEDILDIIKEKVPFLNVEKFKEDIKITYVTINERYGEINIIFTGICKFFNGLITLNYKEDYKISEFQVS